MAIKRYAVIPARGNSKGIVRKNLHPLAGRPLLSYTVEAALDAGLFHEVVVSSESPEILAYASSLGAVAIPRPDPLSRDEVHSVHVVLHATEARGMDDDDVVCMLLPTSPLRSTADIRGAVEAFEEGGADAVVSVYRDTKHLLNLRHVGPDGLMRRLVEGDPNVQRQDVEPLFVVNGSIYVSRVGTLRRLGSFHVGRVRPFVMDRRASVDINSLEDVEEAERALTA